MRLVTFGKVRLEESGFSRPKPLLLLAYLALEGSQDRRKLADLFWRGSDDKRDVQKRLGQLSVVLAQFKKEGAPEAVPDKPGVNPISSRVACDALLFCEHLRRGELKEALELYRGPFLHDLGKPLQDLDVSGEVQDWVLEKRESFAEQARAALLDLAEEAHERGELAEARGWAEQAYALADASDLEPAQLSRLQRVLRSSGSEVTKKVARAVNASLDEVSPEAREVFLALGVQGVPHLAAIREALKLSIAGLSEAREELLLAGLVDADSQVLAKDMVQDWLTRRPAERVPLLMKLARALPAEEAFGLYHSIYRETKGFGGIGDVQKARKAYLLEAQRLMDARAFSAVVETLAELREVEALAEAEPEPRCRFLEAYGLERLGRYKEAFERLQGVPEARHDPDIAALKSNLLWRLGRSAEARVVAEAVAQNSLEWLWARATATNTLGYLASSSGDFLGAASHFKRAAVLFQAANAKDRWAGSLNNYANELNRMVEAAYGENEPRLAIQAKVAQAASAYQEALAALGETGENPLLRARILLNLGFLWDRQQNWAEAEACYLQAVPLAEEAEALELLARLQLNLGLLYHIRSQVSQARASLGKAVETAAEAGEPFIQGLAIANLARLDEDPDALEVGLELLAQSGHAGPDLDHFLETYQAMLERLLEQARSLQDGPKERLYREKLAAFYERTQPQSHRFGLGAALSRSSEPN